MPFPFSRALEVTAYLLKTVTSKTPVSGLLIYALPPPYGKDLAQRPVLSAGMVPGVLPLQPCSGLKQRTRIAGFSATVPMAPKVYELTWRRLEVPPS